MQDSFLHPCSRIRLRISSDPDTANVNTARDRLIERQKAISIRTGSDISFPLALFTDLLFRFPSLTSTAATSPISKFASEESKGSFVREEIFDRTKLRDSNEIGPKARSLVLSLTCISSELVLYEVKLVRNYRNTPCARKDLRDSKQVERGRDLPSAPFDSD